MRMFSNCVMQSWLYTVVAEIKSLQSNLTLEQIHDKEAKLRKEVRVMAKFANLEAFSSLGQNCCRHVLSKQLEKF